MYKLLLFTLLAGVVMLMQALQTDEELAMHTLFQGKHAVNRAAHAAAQQLDSEELARGRFRIDPMLAGDAAGRYLQANLLLDDSYQPVADSFLKSRVDVLAFEIINSGESFPYTYTNSAYGYEVTLQRPGVVMIIRMEYPRMFGILGPVVWDVKGTGELTAK
ncbi:hypothetical protein [Paenibacillus sp. y28]|uniref:hypothetical protein n=1 Tax=Paenibacillus sp. y28 TaxID=3129110 RepID=UPI003018FDAF